MDKNIILLEKYPSSPPCSCDICKNFCKRPGWWTVSQAEEAINIGYSYRMMLEVSPDGTFGVISPAFRGCGGLLATNTYAENGCIFLTDGLCELHATDSLPLECAFCHHDRIGMGKLCHFDIENDWRSRQGNRVVKKWCNIVGLWNWLDYFGKM